MDARLTRAALLYRSQPHILVVEDDREMAIVVRDALEEDGCDVSLLSNAIVALADLVARHSTQWGLPDLIITDLRLPGFTGIELLTRLRRSGCTIPAIVMSGFANAELRCRVHELGVVRVFDKPFDVDDLRAAVRDQLAERERRP